MSNIIRSQSQALGALQSRRAGQTVSRSALRRVKDEVEEALVTATRVEGTAYLTHLELGHVGSLSALEAQVTEMTPASDPIQKEQVSRRASMLVDNFAVGAASEIARRGR